LIASQTATPGVDFIEDSRDSPKANMSTSHSKRLNVLDLARTIGMLLVCTNHFVNVYNEPYPGASADSHPLVVMIVNAVCRVASPLFVLTSGLLLGYLHTARSEEFSRLRLHLFDRAIFLATIGHVLIALAFAPQVGIYHALSFGYMTDTLAFCTIAGLLLVPFMPVVSTRLWFGIILYLTGWAGWYLWHPDHPLFITLRSMFLGPDDQGGMIFYDALLPWFGVYLIGTCVGSWLSTIRRDHLRLVGKTLATRSAVVMSIVISIALPMFFLGKFGLIEIPPYLVALGKKYPPGLFYLLIFGSAALFLLGGLLFSRLDSKTGVFWTVLKRLGRNSFPIFVIQYVTYYAALFLLVTQIGKPTVFVAVVLYISSLLGIVLLGLAFDRFGVNRFWTVGLQALVRRWPVLNDSGQQPSVGISSTRRPHGLWPNEVSKKVARRN
jgi:uncharacterized membrane protein